jgi:hypothetical protein
MCLSSDMICTWPEVDKRRTKSRLTTSAFGVNEGNDGRANKDHGQEEEEQEEIQDDQGQDQGFDGGPQSHHDEQDQLHEPARGPHDRRPNQNNWDRQVPDTGRSLTATGHTLNMPGFDMIQSISDSPRRISSFTSDVRASPLPNLQLNLSTYDHINGTHNDNSNPYSVDGLDGSDGMLGMDGFPAQMDQIGSGGVYSAAHEYVSRWS